MKKKAENVVENIISSEDRKRKLAIYSFPVLRELIFLLLISSLIFTEYKWKEYNLKERIKLDSNNFNSFLIH